MTDYGIEINYVLINKDNKDYVVRVLEPPNYKKVDLDPKEAYIPAYLPDNYNKKDYPGIFNEHEVLTKVCLSPMRKVMCHIGKCDFCDRIVGSENLNQEYTDINNKLGYFYCKDCTDIFEESLKRTGVEKIWYLRKRQTIEDRYCIWVPRTRRDENGNRIKYGPYKFEKWMIYGWYAYEHKDENDILKPHVICENEEFNKLVPIDFINELNPENDTEYNPNDDPKWK